MSRVTGFRCDADGCDMTAVTRPQDSKPAEWITVTVYGDRLDGSNGSWNFCSWPCVRRAMNRCDRQGFPSFAVRETLAQISAVSGG